MEVLYFIFWASAIVQFFFWAIVFMRFARYKIPSISLKEEEEPISIIICGRNENENFKKNLNRILNQNYRLHEIIVVNDNSSDESLATLLEFQKKHPNLRIINFYQDTLPGKKQALRRGINASKFDILLLTDADCLPISNDWVKGMYAHFNQDISLGLGYGPYFSHRGFLNIFIQFETLYTAIQYISFYFINLPYMGVGRNLIYRKSLFDRSSGFDKHMHIASGDDDLFVSEVATAQNTTIILHPSTFVFSEPKRSWKGYYNQKTRHFSTGSSYKWQHQLLLGALAASHGFFYLSSIVLGLIGSCHTLLCMVFMVRMLVVLFVYKGVMKKLQAEFSLFWIPLLDFLLNFYYLLLSPALLTGNNKWKW